MNLFARCLPILLLLLTLPIESPADTVILRTGYRIETRKAWEEDERIWLYMGGAKTSIPKSAVKEIAKSPLTPDNAKKKKPADTASQKPTTLSAQTKRDLSAGQKGTQGNPDPTVQKAPSDIINGASLLHPEWDTKYSNFTNLQKVHSVSDQNHMLSYTPVDGPPKLDDIDFKTVTFTFWQDRLCAITFVTESRPHYLRLREKVFELFGKKKPASKENQNHYTWSDKTTRSILDYSQKHHEGTLLMSSIKLQRCIRMSKYLPQKTYRNWAQR